MTRRGVVVGSAAATVLLGLAGPLLLRRAEFFKVRQVEVVGARYFLGGEVARALRLPDGLSMFDRFSGLAERVRDLPGIREARVGRRWPGTLVVGVREAEPVAFTPDRGRLKLMDESGTILPFDPTRAPADLPVAEADRAVGMVLTRVRDMEPALFAEVQWARRVQGGIGIALEVGGRRYLLGPNAGSDAIRAVAAVARDLERQGWTYQELDARFTDRVLVRGRRAGAGRRGS